MRTLVAGSRAAQRQPLALIPMTVEAIVVGVLIVAGIFPSDGSAIAGSSAFPLNVFFDVKHWLSTSTSWWMWAIVLGAVVLARGGVLALTLWLAEGRPGSVVPSLLRAARLSVVAALLFVPSATFLFAGVAIRYAPFIWVGAFVGFVPALFVCRKALALDAGAGSPGNDRLPRVADLLAYGYLLALAAAAASALSDIAPVLAAAFVVTLGPVHALVFLGWREQRRAEFELGSSVPVLGVTIVVILLLFGSSYVDRNMRDWKGDPEIDTAGSLLLLGGADSTSRTGSLTDLDPRDVGFGPNRTALVSYRSDGDDYEAADTRRDLGTVARVVAERVGRAEDPVYLLGHSQAALILDRMMAQNLEIPERSVVVAPPPPVPPSVNVTRPGRDGIGRPAGDLARAFAGVFDAVGVASYNIDVPASPVNLRTVVVVDERITRLAVWALGDSVWLDGDWRRPGELNVIAPSDHVGAVANPTSLQAAARFLGGGEIQEDGVSWRSIMVNVLSYAFEPWRPG